MSTEYLKDIMEKVIKITSQNTIYSDIIFDKSESLSIIKDKVEEKIFMPSKIKGVGIRVLKSGQWREASLYDIDNKKRIIDTAKKISKFTPIGTHSDIKLKEYKPWNVDTTIKVKIPNKNISIEEKLGIIRDYYKKISLIDNRIHNIRITFMEYEDEKIFVNSEGSNLRQVIPRTKIFVNIIAKEGSRIDYDYLSKGGVQGFELVKNIKDEDLEKTANSSIELLNSSEAPSGKFDVILSPSMNGTFAHESFGHGCEADQVLRDRSYLINHLGKRVSNDEFNLYDDGSYQGGYGTMVFDDEGVKTSKTPIVEKGILKSLLHNRMTASLLNADLTGNTRRESFMKKPFVRMTNTYVGPGNYELNEMISEIKKGVILLNYESGMEDPIAGGMQLKAKKGYFIKNGKKTKILSNLALTGNVLDFVSNINAISKLKDFSIDSGNCGKGHEDFIPVGSGGPYLKSRAIISQG